MTRSGQASAEGDRPDLERQAIAIRRRLRRRFETDFAWDKDLSMDDIPTHRIDWFIAVGYSAIGEQMGFKSFTGAGAKEQAHDHFASLKKRPECIEAWWAKLTNSHWELFGMEKRSTQGEWIPTQFHYENT